MQIPSTESNGSKRSVPCMFQGMHNRRVTLEAGESLRPGHAVSVEYDDTLFLGEVVSCIASGNTWSIEVKVEQILNGLQSLMALRSRLLSEGVPQPFEAARAQVLN